MVIMDIKPAMNHDDDDDDDDDDDVTMLGAMEIINSTYPT